MAGWVNGVMTIEVITCGKVMGVEETIVLYPQLLTVLLEEKQIGFDCSQIEQIDMAALQMLYAFSIASSLYGNEVSWDTPSHAFIKASQLLGLAEKMGITEAKYAFASKAEQAESEQGNIQVWNMTYRPDVPCNKMTREPVSLFQTLSEMGQLTAQVDDNALPPFSELEPSSCYLAWQLTLTGSNDEQTLYEVFAEQKGSSQLEITPHRLSNSETDEFEQDSEDVQIDIMEMLVEEEQEQNNEQILIKELQAHQNEMVVPVEVNLTKVEELTTLIGEFVITQSALSEIANNFTPDLLPQLNESVEQLQQHTREMHETVMQMSMRPVGDAFKSLPMLVQTLSQALSKKVEITVSGEQEEINKVTIESLAMALSSLATYAISHSIETPQQRQEAGKPETGRLQINAYQQADQVVIEISDDGVGLDEMEIRQKAIERGLISTTESLSEQATYKLIFIPGFSAPNNQGAPGLDVVVDNIQQLGGSIDVSSQWGEGTSYSIRLPMSSTIIDGQVFTVAGQKYVLPLTTIIESFEFDSAQIKQISGRGELYPFENDYIPILRLYQLFNIESTMAESAQGLLVVVEENGQKVALFVDDILSQQQVVVKDLAIHYRKVLGFAGATILGHNKVALILDVSGLIKLYKTPSLARVYMSEQGK